MVNIWKGKLSILGNNFLKKSYLITISQYVIIFFDGLYSFAPMINGSLFLILVVVWSIVEYNFRLRAGIDFNAQNLSLLFYGDAYLNNLIGFEPITFNQRTEHYFDKPYGELGLKFQFKF